MMRTAPWVANPDCPQIMGIINVTPDSFSGDGLYAQTDWTQTALAQAERMVADGATLLDIGGESTRPGANPVSAQDECARTIPIIAALRARFPALWISIDTTKPDVAEAALQAGADIINDVGGLASPDAMRHLAARTGAYLVVMHNSARTDHIETDARKGNAYQAAPAAYITGQVTEALHAMAVHAQRAGIAADHIIVDPGIGFGKTTDDNLRLIRGTDRIAQLGYPVLLAPSRKNFIGQVLDAPPQDRLEGTAACVAIGAFLGAHILRVHDVRTMARTARMAAALRRGTAPTP